MGMWLCSALLFIALSVWSLKVVYSAPCAFDVIFSSGGRVISYNSSLNASSCKDTEGCSCIITAPLGHHIRLEFDTFQLSDLMFDGWPVQDWLNVYDGNTTNDVLLGNFTGAMRPFTLQSSSRFMMVMLKRAAYYLRCTFEGVYTYSATKDKPKIKIPSRVVRTVPGHVLWCSAEGFPPINISLLKDSTTLDNTIGKVTSKIFKEGIYTCLARNEVGSDSREIRVTFVDCRNTCSKTDGKVVNGQIENIYSCIKTGSSIDIFKCLPTTATNLTLQWNKIGNVPRDAFRHMAALKFLNLEQNEISTFSPDAFEDLKELHELNLQHNHIRNLSANTFSSLTALQLLDLKFNKIQYLPTGIFSKLTNLRELNLASNTIQNLSAGIFSKQLNLWKLDLEYNMIEKLDERMLPELSDLRYLNLADNKIKNLSAGLFSNQKELSYLDLESNNIQCLPTGIFSKLTILQTLDLGYNKIEKLDERMLPELSDLRYLNLAGNKIKNLSAGLFSNQKELRYLFFAK
ncbi:hypothetical protein OS493_013824 [Desmophyllum pertusum]|uniref:Ig-like domain-containing protein n=1 Tax=Desmophyllum pertusum TaxID=174260 RepID=A0A9W9ZQU3_9CNID|nr:hypothetical protein OS493_013824 [Desmophyllum pertusum]